MISAPQPSVALYMMISAPHRDYLAMISAPEPYVALKSSYRCGAEIII